MDERGRGAFLACCACGGMGVPRFLIAVALALHASTTPSTHTPDQLDELGRAARRARVLLHVVICCCCGAREGLLVAPATPPSIGCAVDDGIDWGGKEGMG